MAELAKYSRMHPPLSPRFVRMTQPPMRILYFLQRNDEAAAFAERLRGAGVPVQLFEIKGAMHGYDIARRAEFLKPIMKRRAEFLRGVFNQKTK